MTLLPDPREQPTMRAPEVAKAYGVSLDGLYDAVRRGDFPVQPRRIGRSMRWITAEVATDLGVSA